MWILKFSIILVLAIQATAVNSSSCKNGMDVRQYEQEVKLNVEVLKQLKEAFGEEPKLISKILSFLFKGNNQIFQLFPKIVNSLKFTIFVLVAAFLLFAICLKFGSYFLKSNQLVPSQVLNNIRKITIAILCLMIIIESFKGIQESSKLQKSINHFICKLQDYPANIIKGQQPISQTDTAQLFIGQALTNFTLNFLRLKPALYKLRASRKTIEASQLIMQNLQTATQQSKQYKSKIKMARDALSLAQIYSMIKPRTLYDAYRIPNRILQAVHLIQSLTKTVDYLEIKLQTNISVAIKILKNIFYLGIIFVLAFALYKEFFVNVYTKKEKQINSIFIYFAILFLLLCTIILLVSSALLPVTFWTNTAVNYTFTSQPLFFQEFKALNEFNPQIPQMTSMIMPFQRNILKIYSGKFQNQTKTIISALRPYAFENKTYFYNLFSECFKYLKPNAPQQNIQRVISQHIIKEQHLIEPLAQVFVSLTNIIKLFESGGSFQKINGNLIGNYLQELLDQHLLLSQNRLVAFRQISHKCLIYFLAIIFIYLVMGQKKSLQSVSKREEIKGIDLNQIY